MKKVLILLAILFIGIVSCSSRSNNIKKVVDSRQSVVLIDCFKKDSTGTMELVAFGSGIVLNEEGYILTCNHVIDSRDSFVVISDNDTFTTRPVGGSKLTDIYLLKIEPNKIKPIIIGDSKKAEIGDDVYTIGYPMMIGKTITKGIVSNIIENGSVYKLPPISYIQTDAVTNPGNSGGALVNEDGELLGIIEIILAPNGYYIGYAYAIPFELIRPQIEFAIKMDQIKK